MALTKEEIEQKLERLNGAKTERTKLETQMESLVTEIKKKYSVADGKELQEKIKKLTKQKTELQEKYTTDCEAYEKLEEEAGL